MLCYHLLKEFQETFGKYCINLAISEATSLTSMGPHRSLGFESVKLRRKIVKCWTVNHLHALGELKMVLDVLTLSMCVAANLSMWSQSR